MPKTKKIAEQIEESPEKRKKLKAPQLFLSTGSKIMDLVAGGLGYGIGKIVNIVGDKSSGKTLLAAECIAAAYHKDKKIKWFYDDAEAGYSLPESLYGIKIVDEDQKNSHTVEEFEYNLGKKLDKLKKNEKLIYVLDCLDALTSAAEIKRAKERKKAMDEGKDYDKGTYGMEKQKHMSEFFRQLAQRIKHKNCLLIIISQVRSNIGVMFGEKYIRTGGKALDFYAAQIFWLAECEKIRKKERVVGVSIKIRNKKNKLGMPFREGFINIIFDYGVDNVTSNAYYLYDMRTKSGKVTLKKVEWKKKTYTPAAFIKYIEENDLEEELNEAVMDKWIKIEKEISSSDRKRRY